MDKRVYKKIGEELQQWLYFKKRHSIKPSKKGKGCKYNRKNIAKPLDNND